MPRTKHHQFNIRLLRSDREIRTAFGPSFAPGENRELATREWAGIPNAILYIGQIYRKSPGWIEFLQDQSPRLPDNLIAGGAGAILFVPAAERILALCFGHAHMALNADAFVRHFGLKVTLNSVPRDQLRSLDTATPDTVTVQKRVQTSKDSDLQAFGVDMYRDLARVAAGTPRSDNFAKFVAGKDALKIETTNTPAEIQNLCDRVMEMYQKDDYKQDFAWVDRIKIVNEKDNLEQLDAKVFDDLEKLRRGNHADLHMSPPEIVDYTEGNLLRYNGIGSRSTNFRGMSIDDYILELNRHNFRGDMKELKERHYISAKNENEEQFSKRWKVFDCFNYETTLTQGTETKHYVLFSGNWYRVDGDFKTEVEDAYNAIKKLKIVGKTDCQNEEKLIAYLLENRDDLLKLDREKINPKSVRYGSLEPCDFFSRKKEFIHLKDGHSSNAISHLWAQGVVSAEAFVSDHDFRVKLRRKVKVLSDKKKGQYNFESFLPKASENLERGNYKVVYGIMRKRYKDGKLGIPFFSKISLQAAVRRINEFGIPVAIELIEKPEPSVDE